MVAWSIVPAGGANARHPVKTSKPTKTTIPAAANMFMSCGFIYCLVS